MKKMNAEAIKKLNFKNGFNRIWIVISVFWMASTYSWVFDEISPGSFLLFLFPVWLGLLFQWIVNGFTKDNPYKKTTNFLLIVSLFIFIICFLFSKVFIENHINTKNLLHAQRISSDVPLEELTDNQLLVLYNKLLAAQAIAKLIQNNIDVSDILEGKTNEQIEAIKKLVRQEKNITPYIGSNYQKEKSND